MRTQALEIIKDVMNYLYEIGYDSFEFNKVSIMKDGLDYVALIDGKYHELKDLSDSDLMDIIRSMIFSNF